MPGYSSVADVPGPWCAVKTTGNMERRVAFLSGMLGIPYFLPLESIIKPDANGDRRRSLRVFVPCYLFAAGDDVGRLKSACEGVSQIIRVEGAAQDVLASELRIIEQTCEMTRAIDVMRRDAMLAVGREVSIRRGGYKHYDGVVENVRKEQVEVRITAIDFSKTVWVHVSQVELV